MNLWQLDEFSAPQLLGYIRNVPEPDEYQGTRWFPNQTISDLEFAYILGAYSKPVMASIVSFDSEAPMHQQGGTAARVQGELPPIKRKIRIGEKMIAKYLQPRLESADRQEAIDGVYDYLDQLLAAVQARVEWLRIQALSEDKILYDEGGIKFQFDFGIDDTFQIDLTTRTDGAGTSVSSQFGGAWTDLANATPIADMEAEIRRIVAKTGRRPAEIVGSETVLPLLFGNAAARTEIRGANAPTLPLQQAELDLLFASHNLPPFRTYDVVMSQEQPDGSRVDVRPLSPSKIFFPPAGVEAGSTLWGPTAESRALLGTPLASQMPGVYAATYTQDEPPGEYIKVAAVSFPTFPAANQVGQMKVTA